MVTEISCILREQCFKTTLLHTQYENLNRYQRPVTKLVNNYEISEMGLARDCHTGNLLTFNHTRNILPSVQHYHCYIGSSVMSVDGPEYSSWDMLCRHTLLTMLSWLNGSMNIFAQSIHHEAASSIPRPGVMDRQNICKVFK